MSSFFDYSIVGENPLLYLEEILEVESSFPEAKSLYSSWIVFDPKTWVPSHGLKIFDTDSYN